MLIFLIVQQQIDLSLPVRIIMYQNELSAMYTTVCKRLDSFAKTVCRDSAELWRSIVLQAAERDRKSVV